MFLCDRLSWTRTIILVKVRLKITMFVGRMMGSRQRRVRWGKACYSETKDPTSSTSFAQSFATVLKLKIPSHLVTDVTGLPKIPWSQGLRNHVRHHQGSKATNVRTTRVRFMLLWKVVRLRERNRLACTCCFTIRQHPDIRHDVVLEGVVCRRNVPIDNNGQ